MTQVVVPLDMQEVYGLTDIWPLNDISCIGPQMAVIDNSPQVTLEEAIIRYVETNKSRKRVVCPPR